MRILYIHQYFSTPKTGWGLRSWHIARHWAEQGHEVFVVTAYDGASVKTETHGNLTIKWLPIPYSNQFPKAQRIAAFRRFITGAIRAGREFLPVDIVYATSTPLTVGLAAIYLKWRFKVPFIFEVRDLWPEAPIQLGMAKGTVYTSVLRRLEREIYRQSKAIVTLSPPVQSLISERVKGKKVVLAPNMADQEFFRRNGHFPSAEQIQVCYTGTFGLANNIPALMAFIKTAQEEKGDGVHFHLAGEGSEKLRAEDFIREHQLINLTFYGQMDTAGVRDLLHRCHFAWVGFRPEPILETNSPNKFFDALAASTPILLSAKGWLKELVEGNEVGFYVEDGNTIEVLKKMEECVRSGGWRQMSDRAGRLAGEFSVERTLSVVDSLLRN
jgi:glycosyltransferase involved in cell wall biosynthesis